jgi:Zn-dependent M28 family amino/carboxypeptidase
MLKHLLICLWLLLTLQKITAQKEITDSIITKELLKEYVSALAHDSMEGRFSGSIGNIKAALYIAGTFRQLGIPFINAIGGYASAVIKNNESYGYNIIAALPGMDSLKKDSIIIFSAHYDHIGKNLAEGNMGARIIQPNDAIFNGANDNASGVAAVLALAKYYNANPINAYTLIFVAFTGEELGMVGSTEFVKKLTKKQVKNVFNLEMLGRPVGNKVRPYVTGINKKMVKQLNSNLLSKDSSFGNNFFREDSYLNANLVLRSDNVPFNEHGVNAITIMLSSPTDQYYHTNDDELETLNFNAMQLVVKAIALATEAFTQ